MEYGFVFDCIGPTRNTVRIIQYSVNLVSLDVNLRKNRIPDFFNAIYDLLMNISPHFIMNLLLFLCIINKKPSQEKMFISRKATSSYCSTDYGLGNICLLYLLLVLHF